MRQLLLSMPGDIGDAIVILLLVMVPIVALGGIVYYAVKSAIRDGVKEAKK